MLASDLMSQSLCLVPQEMSLSGAAHLLSQAQVTGAPVIDEQGKCIGVISSMDFVHLVEKNSHAAHSCGCKEGFFTSSQMGPAEEEKPLQVRDYMTSDPVMVPPSANIGELAEKMMNAHIHRIIVCDEAGKPLGIVSSMDVLAAVAHAYQVQKMDPKGSAAEVKKEVVDIVAYSLE